MEKTDVLIIGQGLAGSLLAYALQQHGISTLIMDNGHAHSASIVAAGLMDAISGMRLTLAWNARTLMPFARSTYKTLEAKTHTSFFFDFPSYRFFASQQERDTFEKKKNLDAFKFDYGPSFENSPFSHFKAPFGGVETLGSGVLQTEAFLQAMARYFKDCLIQGEFDPKRLFLNPTGVTYNDISATHIIFCVGDFIRTLPWFSDLYFRPAKGETLTFSSSDFHKEHVLHFGKWLVPYGPDFFRYGATYEWEDLTWAPTEKGKETLEHSLKPFYTQPLCIHAHQAGIRCMVKDLRPLVGFHPKHPQLGVFGALSSKGVMSAPYYAFQFARNIIDQTPLDTSVQLKRLF